MELFRQVNIDWLGKKWYFLGFSLIFSVAGVLSMLFWHHIPLDVDFRGGTVVRVKFDQQPNIDRIRSAADKAGLKDARIQSYGPAVDHEVIVTLAQSETSEAALDRGRAAIVSTLTANYSKTGPENQGRLDLDNAGRGALAAWLADKDPEHLGQSDAATQHYTQQSNAVLNYRDSRSGLIDSIDSLSGVVTPAVLNELKQDAYLS
ncbi:MAG: protein translocase subunit SecF, partial [Acidobacteriaceae bacterium]|nr:protein translocase subunit SecF [Acidobacteriaceae bacterium]